MAWLTERRRLVLLSFLMLFVELVLIRWAGSNIVYLSYFSNFVLLGSFLGIGIGFLRAGKTRDLFPFAAPGLAILVAFVYVFQVRARIDPAEIPRYFDSPISGLPIWITLPLVFLAIAAVMALIGEGVARSFKRFEPLEAYRLDILGSLLGIVVFSVMSWLSAAPIVWGAVVAALFLVLYRPKIEWFQWMAVVGLLLMLGMQSFGSATWSPYYRIETRETTGVRRAWINGRPHQFLLDNAMLRALYPQYWIPFSDRSYGVPQKVLIIGAGTGADAQVGLELGSTHIDAVDIDPRILDLGSTENPAKPFLDERVRTIATDGRAYLENTDEQYDLIIFGIPDSLTLIAGAGGVRLESYLLTLEAIESAKEHLAPSGTLVVYDYFREPWVADRLGGAIAEVFGTAPCRHEVGVDGREVMYSASTDPQAILCAGGSWFTAPEGTAPPSTDDRPFPYVRGATIPGFYLLSIALALLVSGVAIRQVSGPLSGMRRYADLFFMGAGFLLLETKNVVQFALLFGTTWFVNAFVFGGILLSVLAAIEVARRVQIRHPGRLYVALFASLAAAWLIPSSWLLSLPYALRFVAAVVVAFTPVFIANLVFATRFRDVGSSTVAFGANLLGAMVGGLLEYGALVVGYRGLTVIAGVFYALAWAFGARHLRPTEPTEPVPEPAPEPA